MTEPTIATAYRDYIACLNRQDWPTLQRFVADNVVHNGRPLGLPGYRAMLVQDFSDIPDLVFTIAVLVSDPPYLASRLVFHCTPQGRFLGLPVNGKKVRFTENVFYAMPNGRIETVWSIIDKAAIEAQL